MVTFSEWERALMLMAERVEPMGGYLAGSAVLGLLRGEVMGRDVDVYVGPAGGQLLRRWHPAAPLRGRFEEGGIAWHLHAFWPRPNNPGLDVLSLRKTVSGVTLRPCDYTLDLDTVLGHVAGKVYRFLGTPTEATLLRAQRLELQGWHELNGRALGDRIEALLGPGVKLLDRHLGTDLKGCGGCAKRRARLNALSRKTSQTSANGF